jgi:hypothetical protein
LNVPHQAELIVAGAVPCSINPLHWAWFYKLKKNFADVI